MNAYGYDEEKAEKILDQHKDNIRKWCRLLPPYEDIESDYLIEIDRSHPYGKIQGISYQYLEGLIEYGIVIRCSNGQYKRIQVRPQQLQFIEEPEFVGAYI